MNTFYSLILNTALSTQPVLFDETPVVSNSSLDELFTRVAVQEKVPEKLLRAICWVESKHEIDAYNHSDGKGNNHSFGICQILHSTARSFGFEDKKCYGTFLDHKTRIATGCLLFDPQTNMLYACKVLSYHLGNYGNNWDKVAAAYNAGAARYDASGAFVNQSYVNNFRRSLKEGR